MQKFKSSTIKGSWPVFFSKLLDFDEKARKQLPKLVLTNQIGGKVPPSTELYKDATEELWSIQVTYSEALKENGLSSFIDACKHNKELQAANICIADPESLLFEIASKEINAIYDESGGEEIQSTIVKKGYKPDRVSKFLYPPSLDYTRKLNDMYAALSILKIEAEKENVNDKIIFHTYRNDPTLRATYIYGEKKILDFVRFPKNWIGMTGTMFRCYVDETPVNNKIFKMAEEERKKLGLNQIECNDLIDIVKNILAESAKLNGIGILSFENNRTKYDVLRKRDKIENMLYAKSSDTEQRRRFIEQLNKTNMFVGTQEPEIIILRHCS